MSRTLTITPVPFKSSRLAIPPSPGSPRAPLTFPIIRSIQIKPTPRVPANRQSPEPPRPSPWIWQCHICSRVYPLSTARCVDDGHRFCAGTTTVKRNKRTGQKVVKHKACASEFDYGGWRAVGEWRRSLTEPRSSIEAASEHELAPLKRMKKTAACKDCWNQCDFPSQCRWGKQIGLEQAQDKAAEDPVPVQEDVAKSDSAWSNPAQAETFDDILIQLQEIGSRIDDSVEAVRRVDETSSTSEELSRCESRRKRKSAGQPRSPLRADALDDRNDMNDGFDGLEAAIQDMGA